MNSFPDAYTTDKIRHYRIIIFLSKAIAIYAIGNIINVFFLSR